MSGVRDDVITTRSLWELKNCWRDSDRDYHRGESKIGERFLKTCLRCIVSDKFLMNTSIYYDFYLLRESYRTKRPFS